MENPMCICSVLNTAEGGAQNKTNEEGNTPEAVERRNARSEDRGMCKDEGNAYMPQGQTLNCRETEKAGWSESERVGR